MRTYDQKACTVIDQIDKIFDWTAHTHTNTPKNFIPTSHHPHSSTCLRRLSQFHKLTFSLTCLTIVLLLTHNFFAPPILSVFLLFLFVLKQALSGAHCSFGTHIQTFECQSPPHLPCLRVCACECV